MYPQPSAFRDSRNFLCGTRTHKQELPYSAFIPVLLPIPATNTFVVNQASDRLAADIPAFATSAGTDQIQVYQLSTGALLQSFPLGAGQAMLAFTPDAQYAWVAMNAGLGQLARINLGTQELDQMIQFPTASFAYNIAAQVDPTSQVLIVGGYPLLGCANLRLYPSLLGREPHPNNFHLSDELPP